MSSCLGSDDQGKIIMYISNRLSTIAALLITICIPSAGASPDSATTGVDQVIVRGTVVSPNGKQSQEVKGVCVGIDSDVVKHWYAGDNGIFKLKLEPGPYKIWAYCAKAKAVSLIVPKGVRSISLKVIGRSKNAVSLKFISPQGNPLANDYIGGTNSGGGRTDSNGISALNYIEKDAPIEILFVRPGIGYAHLKISNDEYLYREDPITVRLQRGTIVSGIVASESTGTPLGGVIVFPIRDSKDGDKWGIWNDLFGDMKHNFTVNDLVATTSYDGNGMFSVGPLPPGDYKIAFAFSKEEVNAFDIVKEIPVHVIAGKSSEYLAVKVPLSESMREFQGRALTGKNTAPLIQKEITVSIRHQYPDEEPGYWPEYYYVWEPVVHHVKTNENGRFTLYPLDPGKYVFDVWWNGQSVEKKVTIPSNEVMPNFLLHQPKKTGK